MKKWNILKHMSAQTTYTASIHPAFQLRLAEPEDLDSVYACYKIICDQQSYDQYTPLWELDSYPNRKIMNDYILSNGMLVAQAAPTPNHPGPHPLCAVMALKEEPHAASIHLFGIVPDCRGQGLSIQMMEEAERWALQRGLTSMELDVIRDNLPARKLYEKCGYSFVRDFESYEEKDWLMEFSLYEKSLTPSAASVPPLESSI